MPNLPAALKSMRKDRKRRLCNQRVITELKTLVKKFNALITEKKADEAMKLLSVVMSKFDKAAKKKIIKRKNADRKKSRLSVKLAKISKR